jgi:hypothetical protein
VRKRVGDGGNHIQGAETARRGAVLLTSRLSGRIINRVPVASARISGKPGVMNNFTACRRSPLGLFPGQTVGAEGFTAPSPGCSRLSESRAEEFCGPAGRPNTPEADSQMERKWLQCKHLPVCAGGGGFALY